jgi:hypothetical protein
MIYVINEQKNELDVLSLNLRCRECGNIWSVQLGRDLTCPEHIMSCYRCLAKTSAEHQQAHRKEELGVNDVS